MRSIDRKTNQKYTTKWSTVQSVIARILQCVPTSKAKIIREIILDDPKKLIDNDVLKVSPLNYRFRPSAYLQDAQTVALVKKLADIGVEDLDDWRREKTRQSFLERERENYFWNWNLPIVEDENILIGSVMKHARFFIRTILGECPSLPEFPDLPIGKGVTSTLRGAECNLYSKMQEVTTVSSSCYSMLFPLLRDNPYYSSFFGNEVIFEDYCDIDFVPKQFDGLRLVTYDPSVNKMVQRFYGEQISHCMNASIYKGAYPLSKRPDLHKELVKKASKSVFTDLTTVDVKNASNSLYDTLIYRLLDKDWYNALNKARIKKGYFDDGVLHHFEMFSSNGNGFTFELETLVFYALCVGVEKAFGHNKATISVFGDDILLSTPLYNDLLYVFENIGITVNVDKTFSTDTYFRESCGEDRFYGRDVRPVFFKDFGEGLLSLYRLHNASRKACRILNLSDEQENDILTFIVNRVPKSLRFFGPEEIGDGVLHSDNVHLVKHQYTDERGVVWVCPYTKAIKQLVEVGYTVRLPTNSDYRTVWKIMYHLTGKKAARIIRVAPSFFAHAAPDLMDRRSTIELVAPRIMSEGLQVRGPVKRVKMVYTTVLGTA